MKRLFALIVMMVALATGVRAQDGTLTLTLRPGEILMETSELHLQELAALNAIGLLSLEVDGGWHDYSNAEHKRLLTVDIWSSSNSLLQTTEDVSSTDNIVHELTAADWDKLTDVDGTNLKQVFQGLGIQTLALLFSPDNGREDELTITIRNGESWTYETLLELYAWDYLWQFAGLEDEKVNDTRYVYKRNGEALFYTNFTGDMWVYEIAEDVTEDDNFTYLLNDDDLAVFADWLYLGDGRGSIMVNDCFRYVKSITMAFDVPSGISPPSISPEGESTEASPRGGLVGVSWYTLDGRRLNGEPTTAGIYVKHGKKIIIK